MAAENPKTEGKSVLVLGLGLTGYSVVRHLVAGGHRISVWDSREFPPYLMKVREEFPGVDVTTGELPYQRFKQFSEVVVSPGIGIDRDEVDGTSMPIGDIELFARCADAPVIGVTGSNGKSTVTMLVSEMLTAAGKDVRTGGNIGTPALDLLTQDSPDFYVLELSSFQLETTHSLKTVCSTILNISEDHMDRYRSLDDYIDAKMRIFSASSRIIYNRQDRHTTERIVPGDRTSSFGMDKPPGEGDFGIDVVDGERWFMQGKNRLVNTDKLTLQGEQNVANTLAAMALVHWSGVELNDKVIGAAMAFGGLPHRCEVVAEVNAVKWINDSKGTNVGATVAAIDGIHSNIVLIAGGRGKGADFSELADAIRRRVKFTILYGEDAATIDSSLDASTQRVLVSGLDEAVGIAMGHVVPGDVVLFSPACASFDMFDNFEQRGNAYKNLVLEMVH